MQRHAYGTSTWECTNYTLCAIICIQSLQQGDLITIYMVTLLLPCQQLRVVIALLFVTLNLAGCSLFVSGPSRIRHLQRWSVGAQDFFHDLRFTVATSLCRISSRDACRPFLMIGLPTVYPP